MLKSSEPGQGTTVRIYLPRAREEEDVEIDVGTGPASGGNETVLVVEDDEDVRATVVDMLSELGYRVLRAKNAEGGLAIIENGVPIDILFVMPGTLRSPELARKARERLPNLAVLFTSGYTDNAIVHGGRLDDGVDLLSKSYSREALARKLRHVLHNQQQRNLGRSLPSRSAGKRWGAPPESRTLRVLVVEDDAMIRSLTVEMLAQLGHYVAEAAHANEAFELLDQREFDVLMADLVLPDVAGEELAARAVREHSCLRVVFASGYEALPQTAQREELRGAVLLRKPYDVDSLAEALSTASASARAPADF
jgi:CheY-like chemotaxis protein